MEQAQRASLLHRLKRRELWVSLWLTRLLGLLQQFCGEKSDGVWRGFIDRALLGLTKALMSILLCHAAARVKVRAARGFRDPRRCDIFTMRAAFGTMLRCAFKAKTLHERIEKIRHALERRDQVIARLARRLRRGLSRLASAHTRALFAGHDKLTCAPCAPAISAANTS